MGGISLINNHLSYSLTDIHPGNGNSTSTLPHPDSTDEVRLRFRVLKSLSNFFHLRDAEKVVALLFCQMTRNCISSRSSSSLHSGRHFEEWNVLRKPVIRPDRAGDMLGSWPPGTIRSIDIIKSYSAIIQNLPKKNRNLNITSFNRQFESQARRLRKRAGFMILIRETANSLQLEKKDVDHADGKCIVYWLNPHDLQRKALRWMH